MCSLRIKCIHGIYIYVCINYPCVYIYVYIYTLIFYIYIFNKLRYFTPNKLIHEDFLYDTTGFYG